jgi:hypothetical protein
MNAAFGTQLNADLQKFFQIGVHLRCGTSAAISG